MTAIDAMTVACSVAAASGAVIRLPQGNADKLMRDAKALTAPGADRMISGLATMQEIPGFIYVATPYSKWANAPGLSLSKAASAAAKLTGELMAMGIKCYSPIAHCHYITLNSYLDPLDHRMWMEQCAPMMEAASGCIVLQLPGWNNSKGVAEEVAYFSHASKPVHYVDPCRLLPGYVMPGKEAVH